MDEITLRVPEPLARSIRQLAEATPGVSIACEGRVLVTIRITGGNLGTLRQRAAELEADYVSSEAW